MTFESREGHGLAKTRHDQMPRDVEGKMVASKETNEQLVCFLHRPKFGGKYCTGERKRYRLCNVHPCRPDVPTFRQMQCSEFDTVPYKNELYHWFPVFNPGKEL